MARLHRAAMQIEGEARSAGRRSFARTGGIRYLWHFSGADLLRALAAAGLEVTSTRPGAPDRPSAPIETGAPGVAGDAGAAIDPKAGP